MEPRLLIPLASDAGHFNNKGHYYLGKAIASLMNDLGRFTTDEYYGNMDGLNII